MNIVQSGLSASIRALELELGTPLFVRTTRRVELTVAGRVLYEKAQHMIAGAREARQAVAAISGLERGSLNIGTCASLNAFFDLPYCSENSTPCTRPSRSGFVIAPLPA